MKNMEEVICMAKIVPEDLLIRLMEQALSKYKSVKNLSTENELMAAITVFQIKIGLKDGGIGKMINEINQVKNVMDTLSGKNN